MAAIAALIVVVGTASGDVRAQIPFPPSTPVDPSAVFVRQCGTCHTAAPGQPHRQGPNLFGIVGRRAGSASAFSYSPGLAGADFAWDEARLDAYLANPQAVIATSTMAYRQPNPSVRQTLIDWLKEQR